jgi:hypothetical protein
MKNYKDFDKSFIGASDTATLILAGYQEGKGIVATTLDFGEDGIYKAYIVDDETEIGSHYTKVATFNSWLKIYDDDELTSRIKAKEINIYRAGDFGCIIQLIKER